MGILNDAFNSSIEGNLNIFEGKTKREQNEMLKDIYSESIKRTSLKLKNDLLKSSRHMIKENKKFEKDNFSYIESIWNKAFDILYDVYQITSETMNNYADEFDKLAAKENNLKYYVIKTIHNRIVLCFNEAFILLKNGYSEGAMKIWRTMYELTTVAKFIKQDKTDNDLPQKYIDHIIVDNYKEEIMYRDTKGVRKKYTEKTFRKMTKEYNKIIKKYGKNFNCDYGWAEKSLNGKSCSFYNIADKAKCLKLYPFYKTSCYSIHGNYKANIDKINLIKNNVLLYGPSDYGLSIPIQNIAISLNQANCLFFTIYSSYDNTVAIEVIRLLLDELLPLADSIQNNIKNENIN